jgi:hypothetical protein
MLHEARAPRSYGSITGSATSVPINDDGEGDDRRSLTDPLTARAPAPAGPQRFTKAFPDRGLQGWQWRCAYDALNGVCFAVQFALLSILVFSIRAHDEGSAWWPYLAVIAGCEMVYIAGVTAFVNPMVGGWNCFLVVPGAIIAPLHPLALLVARLRRGDEYDYTWLSEDSADDVCAADFATAAAAELLGTTPMQCAARSFYCHHQMLLLATLPVNVLNVISLMIFVVTEAAHLPPSTAALGQWTLLLSVAVLLLPVYTGCKTTDNAMYCFFVAAGWHDGLAVCYVLFTMFDLFDAGGRWIVLSGLAAAACWTALDFVVSGAVHFANQKFALVMPRFALADIDICVACFMFANIPIFALMFLAWPICGKMSLCLWALDGATGGMAEARKWVTPLWRFCGRGIDDLRRADGPALAADREYADRVRAAALMFLEDCFSGDEYVRGAVQPPYETAARDGATHVMQQPAIADVFTHACAACVTAAKARCYAEVWTMCAQPEYQYGDIVNQTDRCDVLMPGEDVFEAKVVRHTGVFAHRAVLFMPPMLMWVCVPFYVAYTSRAALSGPHIAMLVVLLLSLLTSVALSPRVARFARFCLCVAPLRNLCRDTAADVLGTGVANLVTQYYRVPPATVLRAVIEPSVLPAAVLRDHVAPLMGDASLAELSVEQCDQLRRY